MVTQAYFGFHFVAVGHGHVVHIVAKTNDTHILSIGPTCTNTHPDGNFVLSSFVFPIADHHFTGFAKTTGDMSKFAVSVCTLIQIHKIHVHGIPRYLFVVLGMQMQQGLLKIHQAVYPHFGRRKSVHPCNNTYATGVGISSSERSRYFIGRIDCAFINHFNRQSAGVVQTFYHFIGMCINRHNCITTVQQLCTGNEPYFKIAIIHSSEIFIY